MHGSRLVGNRGLVRIRDIAPYRRPLGGGAERG